MAGSIGYCHKVVYCMADLAACLYYLVYYTVGRIEDSGYLVYCTVVI
jgi:hypothetical protein